MQILLKSYFHEILSISLKLIRLVSLILKNSVVKKCLNHELCERSFYDESPFIWYVHDLTMPSIIKGKLKLRVSLN